MKVHSLRNSIGDTDERRTPSLTYSMIARSFDLSMCSGKTAINPLLRTSTTIATRTSNNLQVFVVVLLVVKFH